MSLQILSPFSLLYVSTRALLLGVRPLCCNYVGTYRDIQYMKHTGADMDINCNTILFLVHINRSEAFTDILNEYLFIAISHLDGKIKKNK